ncbi:hypothetical protein AB0C04_00210 [Micromonospora sp. NPDC048909]|uniref:hypothetical protein n=1 Tax=Micromonospora sp. NPDC048909 TaxID=3155643 RepID=UPI003407B87D
MRLDALSVDGPTESDHCADVFTALDRECTDREHDERHADKRDPLDGLEMDRAVQVVVGGHPPMRGP